MDTLFVDGMPIYYPPEERRASILLRQVAEKSVHLNQELWGLSTPQDFRLYVMTSWRDFFSHAAPRNWQILIKLVSPLLYPRVDRMWPYVGGWEQRFGARIAVGVKPPSLMSESDTSLGEKIFCQVEDIERKFQLTACHEITHGYSTHLALPAWLKEGIAMVTVDHYAGEGTVRPDTLDILTKRNDSEQSGGYRSMRAKGPQEMIYIYVRGYWVTRYLEATRPGLLKSLFDRRYPQRELETRIAAAYDMTHDQFWESINDLVASHFEPAQHQ